MSDVLTVAVREKLGTANTRRLRDQGQVPVVLYGHGGENVHLSVAKKEVNLLLRHHTRHVELAGGVKEHAIVKDLQWDPLGIEVLHMDLVRISLDEKVKLTVPIKFHGQPIGLQNHGSTNEILHEVEILVPATNIPDELQLNINDLDVGGSKIVADIALPEGGEFVTDSSAQVIVMSGASASASEDAEEATDAPTEPEVIGEKKEEAGE